MMIGEKVYMIYDFIAIYIKEWGHAPTLGEIADGVQVHYRTVLTLLDKMDRMGMIERQRGKRRGVKLVRREANWNALLSA